MKDEIVKILKEFSEEEDNNIEITYETDLIENKILDSLNLVMFLFEIDEKFGVVIDVNHLSLDVLKNVNSIAKYLEEIKNDKKCE